MAENTPTPVPAPEGGTPAATGSQPNNSATSGSTFDPTKITPEQMRELTKTDGFWKEAFEHDKFKSLNEKAKKVDEYEKRQAKDEEDKLKEQNKWKELAERHENTAKEATTKAERMLVDNRIIVESNKLGIVDPDAAIQLLNREGITVKDNTIEGVKEALETLVKDKPYLLKPGTVIPNIGSGSNPSPEVITNAPTFTASQIQDQKFYQEHKTEIYKAMQMGLIIDDLSSKR